VAAQGNRVSGTTVAQIPDPLDTGKTSDGYFGGPVLGSKRDAIAFAGGAFSGRASSSQEHDEQRVLSSFDLTSGDAEARMAVCRAGSPGFVGRSYALHCGPGDE
jgi:hypothetical protein